MAKTASRGIGLVSAALAIAAPVGASGQGAPPAALAAPPVAVPAMAAQKGAVDAMAEADRMAVQDARVWSDSSLSPRLLRQLTKCTSTLASPAMSIQ